MRNLNKHKRQLKRDIRKLGREARRLDVNIKLLSASRSLDRDADGEPMRMIGPSGVQSLSGVEIREDVGGTDFFDTQGSRPALPKASSPLLGQGRPAAWVTYGLHSSPGASVRANRGPVPMLSRRHDRALSGGSRHDQISRNRFIFALILLAMAGMVAYHMLFR